MKAPSLQTVRVTLLVLFVLALVCVPFVVLGEAFALPLLEAQQNRTGALIAIAVVLLAADSVAPVPSIPVIMYLAAKAGVFAGIIGGFVGLSVGVWVAALFGRTAVGRIAPKFIPEAELARLRAAIQGKLVLTLACLRSVPVLAETSVILAAATGVPVKRIFLVTLLPNLVIATIYALAADASLGTAAITLVATLAASYVLWRALGGAGRSKR